MNRDIAVIGIAGRFPGAPSMEHMRQVLREGRDCVQPISKQRFMDSTLPIDSREFMIMGMLDQVDKFDHKFFNISLREAQYMDPHQRIMLELAYETIDNAGYPAEAFDGSNTAVIVGSSNYEYGYNLQQLETHMVSGNSSFAIAGRIARFFNMRGSTMMVDTGCSSGLMAVNMACDQLLLGNADTAMVLGARVVLFPPFKNDFLDVGVTSQDGKTRSFNDGSTGSGSSEAAVSLLLKPLAQAEKDRDHIYAVIKSIVNNSSGQSSASLTATSSVAQSQLLELAWRRGGIDPESVNYFEAHGSGTQLGDPIEIKALDRAYSAHSKRRGFVAVSCVKSNIGHTDQVAGLAGFAKAVLAVKHGELYPSLHFDKPNPFIDFANSVAYINTELRDWTRPADAPRRAGVSSYGFAGNNVHAILEEPPPPPSPADQTEGEYLVTLSARYAGGVPAAIKALRRHLEGAGELPRIADISYTLNAGRTHYKYRRAFLVSSREELERSLVAAEADPAPAPCAYPLKLLYFLASDRVDIDQALPERYSAAYPEFDRYYSELITETPSAGQNPVWRSIVFQTALYRLLRANGLQPKNVIGVGSGDIAVRLMLGEIDAAAAHSLAIDYRQQAQPDMQQRVGALVERETRTQKVGFLELGPAGNLAAAIRALDLPDQDMLYAVLDLPEKTLLPQLFRALYEQAYPINWQSYYQSRAGLRCALPAYQFEKIRCWYREAYTEEEYAQWQALQKGHAEAVPAAASSAGPDGDSPPSTVPAGQQSADVDLPAADDIPEEWTATEQVIAAIWMELLQLQRVGLDDDFFGLGGHSLFGTMLASRIEKEWNIKLQIKDIFTFSTIRKLAAGVDKIVQEGGATEGYQPITPAPAADSYPLSHSQRSMWIMHQLMNGESLAYNLPVALQLTGPLDTERFTQAFRQLVARHESLRTCFVEENGEPRQRILPALDFRIEHIKAGADEVERLLADFVSPFDLNQAPLLRVALATVAPEHHVLLFDAHHIIFDGASMPTLMAEFNSLYTDRDLPPLAIHYKDYALWQQQFFASEQGREQESYWLQRFASAAPLLTLPTDFPRPAQREFAGARFVVDIGAERSARLNDLARRHNATLFMTLMAAYQALLHRYTGVEDIVVGSPIAGRARVELENILGMFVNTLPIRSFPRADMSFADFLAQVKENSLEAYRYQDYPFEKLVDKLNLRRDADRHPVFDTVLHMFNVAGVQAPPTESTARRLEITALPMETPTAKFDITLEFSDYDGELHVVVEYATSLFREASLRQLLTDLQSLIDAVADKPELALGDIKLDFDTIEETVEDFEIMDL